MELKKDLIYELDTEIDEPFDYDVTGFESPAQKHQGDRINLNRELILNSNTYINQTAGDAMIGCGIFPNAVVIFERTLTYRSGDIVVVRIGDEFYVRRYSVEIGGIYLRAENPDYKTIEINAGLDYEIEGVVNYSVNSHKR